MNMNYLSLYPILEKEAIKKTTARLKKEGFQVKPNYNHNGIVFDLYAFNNSERRVYEFKITKNKTFKSASAFKKYELLQNSAKEIGARLIFIYINPPIEGASVSFDNLDEILLDDINCKKDSNKFLRSLNNPTIQMIYDLKIDFISVEKERLLLYGSALVDIETLLVDYQDFIVNPNLNSIQNTNYYFSFVVSFNHQLVVLESEYDEVIEKVFTYCKEYADNEPFVPIKKNHFF